MKRRTAIRNVIILGAGATWLASCNGSTKSLSGLKNIPITDEQSDMLKVLTETIIPTTDFIGAKELESSKFLLMMADECASPEDQKKFMDGMAQFEETCQKKYSETFARCSPEKRLEFLKTIEAQADGSKEVINFYQWVKWSTIQSFTTSEEYLTQVKNFSLIPPQFKGCVSVETV